MTAVISGPVNYGFTIIGMQPGKRFRIFISGLEWEAGRLSLLIPPRPPVRPGDFVPVWETKGEAWAAMTTLERQDDGVEYWVTPAEDSWLSGGPAAKSRMLRGVCDFVIPDRPGYIFQADRKAQENKSGSPSAALRIDSSDTVV